MGTKQKVQVGRVVLTPGIWGSIRGPNFPEAYTGLLDPGSGFMGGHFLSRLSEMGLGAGSREAEGRGCPALSFQPLDLGVTVAFASTPKVLFFLSFLLQEALCSPRNL